MRVHESPIYQCFQVDGPSFPTKGQPVIGFFSSFDIQVQHLGVEPKNRGETPQIIHSNRFFSLINHPFCGTTIFGNTYLCTKYVHTQKQEDGYRKIELS